MTTPDLAPSATDIASTYQRIAPLIRRTPTMQVSVPTPSGPRAVELKLELLQLSGTFKARGAFARLTRALHDPTSDPARRLRSAGIVAASGGNHGIAIAHAAKTLGLRANIFVPATAPEAKVKKLQSLGAHVVQHGQVFQEAFTKSQAFAEHSGALTSHAYDQVDTLAGQGSVALEWEDQITHQQANPIDTLLVAVGGGGLIGGICAWWGGRIKIVAVESTGCPTLHAALAAGAPVDIQVGGLAADSLGASRIGALMFPLAQAHVGASILVDEPHIVEAQRWCWRSLRLMVEPGGATALAAYMSGAYQPQTSERVGVLMCGSNLTPTDF
jgi:threonine dehydratase